MLDSWLEVTYSDRDGPQGIFAGELELFRNENDTCFVALLAQFARSIQALQQGRLSICKPAPVNAL